MMASLRNRFKLMRVNKGEQQRMRMTEGEGVGFFSIVTCIVALYV